MDAQDSQDTRGLLDPKEHQDWRVTEVWPDPPDLEDYLYVIINVIIYVSIYNNLFYTGWPSWHNIPIFLGFGPAIQSISSCILVNRPRKGPKWLTVLPSSFGMEPVLILEPVPRVSTETEMLLLSSPRIHNLKQEKQKTFITWKHCSCCVRQRNPDWIDSDRYTVGVKPGTLASTSLATRLLCYTRTITIDITIYTQVFTRSDLYQASYQIRIIFAFITLEIIWITSSLPTVHIRTF